MRSADWSALGELTRTLIRRLLREGLVMRSLIWPSGLAAGTLLMTLIVAALLRVTAIVAVTPDLDPDLRAAMAAEGWEVEVVESVEAVQQWVHDGDAWAGTDGGHLWLRNPSVDATRLEQLLRTSRDSSWSPTAVGELPTAPDTAAFGTRIVRILLLLFALYGVIFGLGTVARDRDDGTLEAELSLPIARWVPGAARWLAATAVLTVFIAYCIAIFHALVGVSDARSMLLHGFAAAGGSVTIGIALIGGAGIKQGFSGPLAFGLTAATGLLGFGAASPAIGQWLPLSSLLAGGSGWVPAVLALLGGVTASAAFAYRSARA